ncbi:patatin-like phospholipase family protein [Metaclostridioides mangenotii]|uniref:patatin-like phospholipase family protein n=1 Tax=Metaclostridioides mangenotii TaxID=1540 RepID=UPI0026E92745|nr:patatin-like phospholipase family protein [Clostridioides mangenotii]
MKLGLCLEGGGAKGAYQAGVIKGLYDGGIREYHSISGTSIGAVNGYFLFTGNIEKMEDMWKNFATGEGDEVKIIDNTVDNSPLMRRLEGLYCEENKMDSNFYINYVEVNDQKPGEVVLNLVDKSEKECLDGVKYSSLYPYTPNGSQGFREEFSKNIVSGLYDGYKLDGGLLNNRLLQPLVDEKVDKIILITMRYDYVVPDSLKEVFSKDNIVVVKPKEEFGPKDTFRFEEGFCKTKYFEGYEIGKNIAKMDIIDI